MATVAELMVRIAADSQPLRKELNATKKQIRDAFGSDFLQVSNMAKTALAGIGASIAAIGVASVKQAANLERVTTAFTNMLGSAEKSSAFIKDLQNFAAKTPFEFTQVTAAAQKFLAFGFTAEQVIPTLTAVGDAAAGVGLGAEGIDRVTLALGQMAAKSKVQSDEMLQLTEAGIPAWQMLADKIGTSVPDAMDKVSKGAVDAQTGISALVEGMQNRFGGMMEAQSKTIAGSWSNMVDGIEQSMAQLGLKIADALNLTEIFQNAGNILSNFAATVQTSGIAEAFKQALPTELQVGIIALSTTLVAVATPALIQAAINVKLLYLSFLNVPGATSIAAAAFGFLSVQLTALTTSIKGLYTSFMALPTLTAALSTSLTGINFASVANGLASIRLQGSLLIALLPNIGSYVLGLGSSMITSITGIASRLAGLAVAFGPVGIAIAAAAVAIGAFLASGKSLVDVFNVVPGTMASVSLAVESVKYAFGEIAKATVTLITALSPLIQLLAVGFTGAVYVAAAALNVVVIGISGFITVVSGAVGLAVEIFNNLANGIRTRIDEISGILGSFADSILPEWANNSIQAIGDFVGTALGLLDSLISKINDTNKALNSVGESKKAFNGDSEKTTKQQKTELPDYSQFKTAGTGGISAGGSKAGGGQDLVAAASQTSKHIEDEWFRTFQSQSAMVDKWYQEESAALEKSAAQNVNYERDKQRLNELYSQKRLEALSAEAQKELEIKEQVRQLSQNSTGLQVEAYGSTAQQELLKMQSDYDSTIAGIENRYAQFSNSFITMTDQQKQAFLAACDQQGIAYQVMEDGMISFAEQAYADKLAAEAAYQKQRIEYFKNAEDIKSELQDAYNAMNIEKFMATLNEENAIRLSNLEATQSLMQTYQEAYMAAHATNLELIAQMSETALGGLSTAFTDILTGAKSAKQAFSDLGKAMIKTIASFFAQQAAGMLMTAILGDTIRNQANARIAADAAAAEAVWAPAAWSKLVVDPSAGPAATALLTEGLAGAAAIATATQSILGSSGQGGATGSGSFGSYNNNSFNDLGGWIKPPGYAKGGYFKTAHIGIIGEGASDEVALPLNQTVFRNLASGIIAESGNMGSTNVNASLNIYGDINTGSDEEDIYDSFGSTILSAIRGRK